MLLYHNTAVLCYSEYGITLCTKNFVTVDRKPLSARFLGFATVGYALSPIDLIPDFIPVPGYLDDIIILPSLIALTIKLIPKPIWESCLQKAEDMWKDGKPVKWYYAIPVIAIWLVIILLIIKAIWF